MNLRDNIKQGDRVVLKRLYKPILIFPFNIMGVIPFLILWFSDKVQILNTRIYSLIIGIILIGIGVFIACMAINLFARIGKGTPAPWDPPQKLVAVGIYQYVRNPMMIAVWSILIGESIIFQSFYIFLWFLFFFVLCLILIPILEEPLLEEKFGDDYRSYKKVVPRWLFRFRI